MTAIMNWLLSHYSPAELVQLWLTSITLLSALGFFLKWLDGHVDGRIPDGWYGWLLKVAVAMRHLTPEEWGRKAAMLTNPDSLTAARSDDILARKPKDPGPNAGQIAAAREAAARGNDFSRIGG